MWGNLKEERERLRDIKIISIGKWQFTVWHEYVTLE